MKINLFAPCCASLLCLTAGLARAEPAGVPAPSAAPGSPVSDVFFSIGPRGEVFEYRRFDLLGLPASQAERIPDESAAMPPEPDLYPPGLPATEQPVCVAPAWDELRAFEPVCALPSLPPDDT
ncbi:MAG: hypothetical protein WCJ18_01830, partial [Planctomycetota bacterium]